jgi:hypothetical protein
MVTHTLTLAKSKIILATVISICLFISKSAIAEERQGLLLNATITAEHDDNVLRKIVPVSDSSLQISPELTYLTHMGKHIFALDYQGNYSAFKKDTKLNYNNHNIALLAKLDHSLKISSTLKLSYQDEIEEPGTNNSITSLFTEFNQTKNKKAAANIYYGTKKSIGQLSLNLQHTKQRYTNNLQDYRDLNRNKATGTFFYRIAQKTRLLFQVSLRDYDYINKSKYQNQSSQETFYLAGVEWDITAKTSGTFKLGYQGKDFDENLYQNIDALSYLLDMTWKPNTYSKVKISASRKTQESSQILTGAFITNDFAINAEHKITARTKLKAAYSFANNDIISLRDRTDKKHNITFGIDHSLLTWLSISLDYNFIQRKSDNAIYEHKANVIALSLTTTFD